MRYTPQPGSTDLAKVLTGTKLKTYMGGKAVTASYLFAMVAPRGSQRRPHTPMAETAEASTEVHNGRVMGVVTVTADYAIADEVGNRSRPRGSHSLQRVATMMGNTRAPKRGR